MTAFKMGDSIGVFWFGFCCVVWFVCFVLFFAKENFLHHILICFIMAPFLQIHFRPKLVIFLS